MKRGSLHSRNIWVGWSSTKSGHSPGSVSALHVRAIETLPQDDRSGRTTQDPVRPEDRRGQQRIARGECVSHSQVQAGPVCRHFISSCFVHIRKPDVDIFRLALDIAQAPAQQVVYIENTPMFVQIAEGLGIRSILHTDYKSTCANWLRSDCRMTKVPSHETADPRILTINGGSSSIKFALFDAATRFDGFWRAGLSGLDCRRPPSR
jgi:hypothetical protein